MDCRHQEAEIQHLRAELARERARVDRLEAMLQEAVEATRTQAEAMVTLARDARSVTVTRDGVTGSVTLVEREERKRELSRVRSQNYRHRHRHASPDDRHAAGTVTPSSPPPAFQGVGSGTLRVVTQAARDGVTPPSVTRNPAHLPAGVRELRQAWNEMVAPQGFPAWGDTSSKLLGEAQAALERRPLGEWRRVFDLVPRSRVCRGELSSQLRYTVVRVLGFTAQGDEVAACLLEGAWSIDPPQEEEPPAPGAVIDLNHLAPGPEGQAALSTWELVLAQLRLEEKSYTLKNLEEVAPVAVSDGTLLLLCSSTEYMANIFGEPLSERVRGLGLPGGVRFTSEDELRGSPGTEESPPPPEDSPEPFDGS